MIKKKTKYITRRDLVANIDGSFLWFEFNLKQVIGMIVFFLSFLNTSSNLIEPSLRIKKNIYFHKKKGDIIECFDKIKTEISKIRDLKDNIVN